MTRALVFDLDDTLYDYKALNALALEQAEQYAVERLSVAASAFQEAFAWARGETKRWLGETAACHNRMLYFQKTLERLGQPPTSAALELYESYWGYILSHIRLRDGVQELLVFCRENNIKVGVCSDLTAHIQHRKLRALGIADHVDALVTSEEAGVEKPDLRMFLMISEKLGVEPENIVYVGDSYEKDILGAEHAGMRALWFLGDTSDRRSILSMREVKGRWE